MAVILRASPVPVVHRQPAVPASAMPRWWHAGGGRRNRL